MIHVSLYNRTGVVQIPVREFTALTSPPTFAARSTASVSCRPARTAASRDVSPPHRQFSSQLAKSFLYSKLVFEQLTARSTRDVGMQELEVSNNSHWPAKSVIAQHFLEPFVWFLRRQTLLCK